MLEQIKSFYFPKNSISPAFLHGFLGFTGAALASRIVAAYNLQTPIAQFMLTIGIYVALATFISLIIKLLKDLEFIVS